jgi:hypothetical protein
MTINKSFGWLAHSQGIQQYTKVMLGCLAASTLLLYLVVHHQHRATCDSNLT